MEYLGGMLLSQKTLKWFPYLHCVLEGIEQAAQKDDYERLQDIFFDALKVVDIAVHRKTLTVSELRKNLNHLLWLYTSNLKDAVNKKRRLKNSITRKGKALKGATLKQYQSVVKSWPKKRAKMKREIRDKVNEIKQIKACGGDRVFCYGNVKLRVIHGGKYGVRV